MVDIFFKRKTNILHVKIPNINIVHVGSDENSNIVNVKSDEKSG